MEQDYIKNQFVTYEIALKLKELGFDEECLAEFWRRDDSEIFLEYGSDLYELKFQKENNNNVDDMYFECKVPLYSQVIDWLREKYSICITINCVNWRNGKQFEGYLSKVQTKEMIDKGDYSKYLHLTDLYVQYEEAREAAILKAIELIEKSNGTD